MDVRKGLPRKNTAAVQRLKRIAEMLDQLNQDLDRVEFLADDMVDKKDFDTAQDLAGKVQSALRGVRSNIGKKGGSNVAKGYKK